jgi:cysteine desulfurase
MREAMECYGNPSSLHGVGQEAHVLLERARRQVAITLGIKGTPAAEQLTFTSCGSESDNLAILGCAYAKSRRRGGRVITTDSEHAGVENAMQALERDGFEVVRISTRDGVPDFEQYANALNSRTFLVSMMMVNNETGAMYDLRRAFAMAKAKDQNIVTHTDAVQGYLKCKFTPQSIKADLVTVSAHKIHGPKGVGALYVSPDALKRRDLVPTLRGGGQEFGFRSGTENVIGIAGFGAAIAEQFACLEQSLKTMSELRNYAREKLATLPVTVNQPKGLCAPHVLSVTLPDIKSETMLNELSQKGICISNGSACSSKSREHSASLTAFGLAPEQIESTIRVSFSAYNTKEEIDALVEALTDAISRLVKIHH